VTFVFTQAGVYKLRLYGSENVFNPVTGNFQNCVASFPDSLNPNSTEFNVRVVDKPYLSFTAPDTVCVNESFNVVSTLDPIYGNYTLDFGDNNTRFADTSEKTITTSYGKPGSFIVKLFGNTSQKISCIDTPSKTIYVQSVKADFSIDESKNPIFNFNNSSIGATEFNWNFGAAQAGNQNTSKDENPSFDYSNYLTSTDSVKICLAIASSRSCRDTICKKIYPFSKGVKLYNVFSPDGDGKNDVFKITSTGLKDLNCTIFNRWGNKLYTIETVTGTWDGSGFADGTYFYVLIANGMDGKEYKQQGTVDLFR
jgi:gliding motility-associated-like protein